MAADRNACCMPANSAAARDASRRCAARRSPSRAASRDAISRSSRYTRPPAISCPLTSTNRREPSAVSSGSTAPLNRPLSSSAARASAAASGSAAIGGSQKFCPTIAFRLRPHNFTNARFASKTRPELLSSSSSPLLAASNAAAKISPESIRPLLIVFHRDDSSPGNTGTPSVWRTVCTRDARMWRLVHILPSGSAGRFGKPKRRPISTSRQQIFCYYYQSVIRVFCHSPPECAKTVFRTPFSGIRISHKHQTWRFDTNENPSAL
jgi:hypothetical protein